MIPYFQCPKCGSVLRLNLEPNETIWENQEARKWQREHHKCMFPDYTENDIEKEELKNA